jgi:hypothetical protein
MNSWTVGTRFLQFPELYVSSSSRAYGEARPAPSGSRVIPSEALGSTTSTKEPLESRATSSACSNSLHECPAPFEGEDVLRSSRKLESWDKEPSEDIAAN